MQNPRTTAAISITASAALTVLLAVAMVSNARLRSELNDFKRLHGAQDTSAAGDPRGTLSQGGRDEMLLASNRRLERENLDLRKELSRAAKANDAGLGEAQPTSIEAPTDVVLTAEEEAKRRVKENFESQLMVGTKLSDEVIEKLGIDTDQAESINHALELESQKIEQALRDLYLANFPDDPMASKVGALPLEALSHQYWGKILPEYGRLREKFEQDPSLQMRLVNGEMSVADVLGPDSIITKLGDAVVPIRGGTQSEVDRVLSAEEAKAFKDQYLMPGFIILPGNLQLDFGDNPSRQH